MISGILSIFENKRSNLDVVLRKIEKQTHVKNVSDRGESNNHLVGSYNKFLSCNEFNYIRVMFGNNNKMCVVRLPKCDEALFMFNDPDDVAKIKSAIQNKIKKHNS